MKGREGREVKDSLVDVSLIATGVPLGHLTLSYRQRPEAGGPSYTESQAADKGWRTILH